METVKQIFVQLGVDSGILNQFVIVCVFFIVARYLFLNKLQFILEERENKTVKLDEQAEEKIQKSKVLIEEYKEKLNRVYETTQKKYNEGKSVIVQQEVEKLKKVERNLAEKLKVEQEKLNNEYNKVRNETLKDVSNLASGLVEKLSK